jgi:hypothetical protein
MEAWKSRAAGGGAVAGAADGAASNTPPPTPSAAVVVQASAQQFEIDPFADIAHSSGLKPSLALAPAPHAFGGAAPGGASASASACGYGGCSYAGSGAGATAGRKRPLETDEGEDGAGSTGATASAGRSGALTIVLPPPAAGALAGAPLGSPAVDALGAADGAQAALQQQRARKKRRRVSWAPAATIAVIREFEKTLEGRSAAAAAAAAAAAVAAADGADDDGGGSLGFGPMRTLSAETLETADFGHRGAGMAVRHARATPASGGGGGGGNGGAGAQPSAPPPPVRRAFTQPVATVSWHAPRALADEAGALLGRARIAKRGIDSTEVGAQNTRTKTVYSLQVRAPRARARAARLRARASLCCTACKRGESSPPPFARSLALARSLSLARSRLASAWL